MNVGCCIEMIGEDLPFEERLECAAGAGLKHVEMWFVDGSYKGAPEDLAGLAERHGVTMTNTVIGSPDGALGGGLVQPEHREQWLARARSSIDFTAAAGIPATIVCTGNVVDGMTDAEMEASVRAGLERTVALAEKAGVTLLLEPLNTTVDHPGYWLTSSDRGAALCRDLGSERLRLLFDCYHMQIMEGDLLTHLERNLDVIGHVHAAGVPGRREVFLGEIQYPYLVRRLESMGYQGILGLEYRPSMDPDVSLRRTLAYLASDPTSTG